MSPVRKYTLWLLFFSATSVASQYGSAIPFSLGTWFGVHVWVPLSAFSVIPLLDCSRSFVQHYAELADIPFRKSAWHMLLIPTSVAFVCSLTAGLPYTIFLGAMFAVTIGGYVDIRVFRWIRFVSRKPHIRMRFSNAAATVSGGSIFFAIAFTNWPLLLGFAPNQLAKSFDALVVGCIAQSIIVWSAGVFIAHLMTQVIDWLEKQDNKTPSESANLVDSRKTE